MDAAARELVDGLRRGDVRAFDRAYAELHPRILGFLLRLSGRRDIAEDLAQETWLKLARAAPSLDEHTNLPAFLFTVARNAFLSHRRWAMLDVSRFVVIGFESLSAVATTEHHEAPDEQHERARALSLLEAALAQLPLASREVLLLVGVEGLEQDEVATVLGISYDAVRQRLHRARAQLAAKMSALERSSKRANEKTAARGTA